jgi:hypothetical protein
MRTASIITITFFLSVFFGVAGAQDPFWDGYEDGRRGGMDWSNIEVYQDGYRKAMKRSVMVLSILLMTACVWAGDDYIDNVDGGSVEPDPILDRMIIRDSGDNRIGTIEKDNNLNRFIIRDSGGNRTGYIEPSVIPGRWNIKSK